MKFATILRFAVCMYALALFSFVGCSDSAEPASCGNGVVDGGEECDDGNTFDGDGCSSFCRDEANLKCGNGVIDAGEECDDGNQTANDGCDANCQKEAAPGDCGDGVKDADEECDDGNAVPYDGCEDDCKVSPDVVECGELPALANGVCEVATGDTSKLLSGNIMMEYSVLKGGQVLVGADGVIGCVGCDCSAQAGGATTITCPNAVIAPGLINSHDHITYAHNFPAKDTGERYEHRHEWRRGKNGHTKIPYDSGATSDQVRWGELRFLVGGGTSTIGSGSATGVLRNLDRSAQEGLNQKPVKYETFPLDDAGGALLEDSCDYGKIDSKQSIAGEDAYFPHVSEGISAAARNEFLCLSSEEGGGEDVLEPQSAFIHGIGLSAGDYAQMRAEGTSLVWSPRSNIALYGNTAVVTTADRLGVRIALGSDWILSGSMNMIREIKCADELNTTYYNGYFKDQALVRMATGWAAEAAKMDDAIGKLRQGLIADIAIFDQSGHTSGPRAIIDGEPKTVALVLRGGTPLYGEDSVIEALEPGNCDTIDVCGNAKRICTQGDIGKSYSDLQNSVGQQYPLFFCGVPQDEPSCKPTRPAAVNGSTTYSGDTSDTDTDGDGLEDAADNCPNVFNPVRPMDNGQQADFDGDGEGDACDVCPIDANTEDCTLFDPTDSDGDGIANESDNCPNVANKDQADTDMDGKGNACDPCPDEPNPGTAACTASIYDIKSGKITGTVNVNNALVTGCVEANGFFVQVKVGDADYVGAENSGIFVYYPTSACGSSIVVGTRVNIAGAAVAEFFGQTQLSNAMVSSVSMATEAAPEPVVKLPSEITGATSNAYEAVLVEVQNVVVVNDAPAAGPGDQEPTNEFEVDDGLIVNDLLYAVSPAPSQGQAFKRIAGIADYRNGAMKLEPRDGNDIQVGAPVLTSFGPSPTFVRLGSNKNTIPTALSVSLSSPAESNTVITISSSNTAALEVVGGSVSIAQGQSSAAVLLNAKQLNNAVTLTASLDGKMETVNVQVIGASDAASVASLSPAVTSVGPGATASFTVELDIPAPPGGSSINLALAPASLGSVAATVTVPADQLSASVTFTAGTMPTMGTLTASLNASSAKADISVAQGPALVINEVDYDNVGTDLNEFVELFNKSSAPVSLAGISLLLVNGNNSSPYLTLDLSPVGQLNAGEYLVIGTATLLANVVGAKTLAFSKTKDNIQNGAPDALGLLDTNAGKMLDVLSYEGSITGAMIPGVSTPVDFFVKNPLPGAIADNNATVSSLVRLPNGQNTSDTAADWKLSGTPTPGAANVQ